MGESDVSGGYLQIAQTWTNAGVELSFFKMSESTTAYTFIPCVG